MAFQKKRTGVLDTVPDLPPAGARAPVESLENAAMCLKPEQFNQPPPPTPEHEKKWRKSWRQQPGAHVVHPGLASTVAGPNGVSIVPSLHPTAAAIQTGAPTTTTTTNNNNNNNTSKSTPSAFGLRTDLGARAKDCLNYTPANDLQSFIQDQKESIYRSRQKEPLGSVPPSSYGPSALNHPSAKNLAGKSTARPEQQPRVGVVTALSESAKNLITLGNKEQPPIDEHDITRQIRRNYNWDAAGIDPTTHRFGITTNTGSGKATANAGGGVAAALNVDPDAKQGKDKDTGGNRSDTHIVSLAVAEASQARNDPLGKAKPSRHAPNLPPNYTFGKLVPVDQWGSAKLISGGYSAAEQQPDNDLGKPRWYNQKTRLHQHLADGTTVNGGEQRVFGAPTVRFDRPLPTIRSVADTNNYGDEMSTATLLYPQRNTLHGVTASEFTQPRTPDEIRAIFDSIGEKFNDEEFKLYCDMATRDVGVLCVDSFRHALNSHKFATRCSTCHQDLCTHPFCRLLACTHTPSANHANHASHSFVPSTATPIAPTPTNTSQPSSVLSLAGKAVLKK